ncbi:hypothetical protein GOP47_0020607 [Adiantum capillus-veneris]|uniref:Uncharacterized protein n=1 Tax=Adiantum capillus-veneris TaxID=13818 RepID=A0A9D4Z7W6_ADICA|nr:hypothetical protein GOP47_0020607 [Adiantum capillus-veneris]
MASAAATATFYSCVVLLGIIAQYCTCLILIPPSGNSVSLSATTENGRVTYTCNSDGKWVPASVAAKLVSPRNLTQNDIGSYYRMFSTAGDQMRDLDDGDVGTWSLLNDDGDAAESGHLSSQVAGKLISTMANDSNELYLRAFLAQASHHQFEGAAARVSYIMQTNASRSALPAYGYSCTKGLTVNVIFKADFKFWNQDFMPPASMPPSIAVNNKQEMLLEAFFAVGRVAYAKKAHHATWKMQGAEGRLFDVPGGLDLGSFHLEGNLYTSEAYLCLFLKAFTFSGNSSTCAKLSMPAIAGPVVVDPHSLPWSLMSVTNTRGNLTNFGAIPTSIQMVSTFGGLTPSCPPSTQDDSYQSNFTSIFWIYARQS